MNVVFIDFDGVLNTCKWEYNPQGKLKTRYHQPTDDNCTLNNFQAICWLNEYCHRTNSDIVVTSSWRKFGYTLVKDCLYRSGLSNNIKVLGITKALYIDNKEVERGYEIYKYLVLNPNIEKITIFDDDSDMGSLDKYHVKCNLFHGLGLPEITEAKKMFEQQEINEWKEMGNYKDCDSVIKKKTYFHCQEANMIANKVK